MKVVITGAASGIGFGIAKSLVLSGHDVIISDLNENALNEAQSLIETELNKSAQSGSIKAHLLDVTCDQSVETFIQSFDSSVDVLVNNAGIQHVESFDTFPIQKWNQLIQIMLVGVARITQAVLPGMKEQNFGRIINIGSLHSLVASPYKSAYIAAKHGLIGFSKTLALEFASTDITINTLCPAYVKTPLVEKQIAAQAKEHGLSEKEVIDTIMLKPMPKKSFIEVEELAGTCEFLMSSAAKNITAQAIALDGGWTAQ